MRAETEITLKIAATVLLLAMSAFALYLALFWGWASGTSPKNEPILKMWSSIALIASLICFAASSCVWIIPRLLKRRANRDRKNA